MNKIIWIVLAVLVAVGAYFYFYQDRDMRSGDSAETEMVIAEGQVSEVNVEGVALDGPALVTIQAEGGVTHVIAVPSMGINLCAASGDIVDVYTLVAGDQVRVRGELDEEGRIVPCSDSSHYLRLE